MLLETGLPFGDLAYYKIQYVAFGLTGRCYGDLVLMARADLGWGDGYSGKPLPFFKAFFAGGVNSVRGYDTASLGPQDPFGNALGGRRKIVGNLELFYPILKGDKAVRASVFADAGQIWANGAPAAVRVVPLLGRRGRRVELADRAAEVQLRYSAQRPRRRSRAAVPVPGRHCVLMTTAHPLSMRMARSA